MRIARLAALMAICDNIIRNSLAQSFIKNEIDADKFIFQTLRFCLSGILNNAAVELKNVLKTLVFEPRACFFAANATRAVHRHGHVGIAPS